MVVNNRNEGKTIRKKAHRDLLHLQDAPLPAEVHNFSQFYGTPCPHAPLSQLQLLHKANLSLRKRPERLCRQSSDAEVGEIVPNEHKPLVNYN